MIEKPPRLVGTLRLTTLEDFFERSIALFALLDPAIPLFPKDIAAEGTFGVHQISTFMARAGRPRTSEYFQQDEEMERVVSKRAQTDAASI